MIDVPLAAREIPAVEQPDGPSLLLVRQRHAQCAVGRSRTRAGGGQHVGGDRTIVAESAGRPEQAAGDEIGLAVIGDRPVVVPRRWAARMRAT